MVFKRFSSIFNSFINGKQEQILLPVVFGRAPKSICPEHRTPFVTRDPELIRTERCEIGTICDDTKHQVSACDTVYNVFAKNAGRNVELSRFSCISCRSAKPIFLAERRGIESVSRGCATHG
ncbi:hypothetical protein RRG08_009132 [Elysia crispata]|uniref:Uncharacterized protein n=1 Tax=Elysia crispata TaxID=231223 RepID=A0AAE0YPR6_9GAST|nr:hypothetical protein RRG08_009132 [Elysia crispata]